MRSSRYSSYSTNKWRPKTHFLRNQFKLLSSNNSKAKKMIKLRLEDRNWAIS